MRRANVVSGIVLALFGLVMLGVVVPWQIDPGPAGMMSPRLVPNLMTIVITGLSVLLVVSNSRAATNEQEEDASPPVSRAEWIALLKLAALLAFATALFLGTSPLVAGIALVVGALLVLGERRPLVLVLMPDGLMAALWLLFYKVLGTVIL